MYLYEQKTGFADVSLNICLNKGIVPFIGKLYSTGGLNLPVI